MFKKIILSFIICISMLCNSLTVPTDTGVQSSDNTDNLKTIPVLADGLYAKILPNISNSFLACGVYATILPNTKTSMIDAVAQPEENSNYGQTSNSIGSCEEKNNSYEETPATEQPPKEEYKDYSNNSVEEKYQEPEQKEETYSTTTPSGDGSYIVNYAKQFVGNPYVYGGNSLTNGVDCSGFTQQVFGNNGISLARTAADQSQGGQDVSMDDLQAGDLLFYDNGGYVGHVAIYCGDGTVVHASNEETGITISDANYRTPVSAKRYW